MRNIHGSFRTGTKGNPEYPNTDGGTGGLVDRKKPAMASGKEIPADPALTAAQKMRRDSKVFLPPVIISLKNETMFSRR